MVPVVYCKIESNFLLFLYDMFVLIYSAIWNVKLLLFTDKLNRIIRMVTFYHVIVFQFTILL